MLLNCSDNDVIDMLLRSEDFIISCDPEVWDLNSQVYYSLIRRDKPRLRWDNTYKHWINQYNQIVM